MLLAVRASRSDGACSLGSGSSSTSGALWLRLGRGGGGVFVRWVVRWGVAGVLRCCGCCWCWGLARVGGFSALLGSAFPSGCVAWCWVCGVRGSVVHRPIPRLLVSSPPWDPPDPYRKSSVAQLVEPSFVDLFRQRWR